MKIRLQKTDRIKRRTDGRFEKGAVPNPNGRRKGTKDRKKSEIQLLREAISAGGQRRQKTLFNHFIDRAYADDGVLVAVMRKVVPDLKSLEALVAGVYDEMPDDVAEGIREKLRVRFGGVK